MRLFLTLAVGAVLAVSPPAGLDDAPSGSGDFCAAQIEPVGANQPEPQPVCFQSQALVDEYLDKVLSPNPLSRSAAASVLIGTVYKDDNYGGGSYTFYGSGSCAGVTYGFPSLSSDWQNSISSAKAYSSCWVTLYDASSYGGQRYNCTPNCASLPSFNDRTKSLVFRPAGTVG